MKSIFLVSRRSLLPLTAFAPRVNSARSISRNYEVKSRATRDGARPEQPGTTGHLRHRYYSQIRVKYYTFGKNGTQYYEQYRC